MFAGENIWNFNYQNLVIEHTFRFLHTKSIPVVSSQSILEKYLGWCYNIPIADKIFDMAFQQFQPYNISHILVWINGSDISTPLEL